MMMMMDSEPTRTSNMNGTCQQLLATRATCAICGAPAIGRNFDAMTCLSCKAFFRRNAYNGHLIYTCRVSSACEITMTTRRYCSACRLKKCFKQGMKKELIRSLSAINQATHKARHPNSSVSSTTSLPTLDLLSHHDRSNLSADDWNVLTNIRNSYEDYCIRPFLDSHQVIPLVPPKQPYRSRLKLQRLVDLRYKYCVCVASYIKRILQYDTYSSSYDSDYPYLRDSYQSLITSNACELMRSKVLECVPWEHDQLALSSVLSEEILQRLGVILNTFKTLIPYDPVIMKLFLIILVLSCRISPLVNKTHYTTMDFNPLPKNFLYSQNFYITLLWKYVQHRLGPQEAVIFSVRLVQTFLRRQVIEGDMLEIVNHREDDGQLVHMIESSMNF